MNTYVLYMSQLFIHRIGGNGRFKTKGGEFTTSTRSSIEISCSVIRNLISEICFRYLLPDVWNLVSNTWYLISEFGSWYMISKSLFLSGELDDLMLAVWQSDRLSDWMKIWHFDHLWKDELRLIDWCYRQKKMRQKVKQLKLNNTRFNNPYCWMIGSYYMRWYSNMKLTQWKCDIRFSKYSENQQNLWIISCFQLNW